MPASSGLGLWLGVGAARWVAAVWLHRISAHEAGGVATGFLNLCFGLGLVVRGRQAGRGDSNGGCVSFDGGSGRDQENVRPTRTSRGLQVRIQKPREPRAVIESFTERRVEMDSYPDLGHGSKRLADPA